MAGGPGTYTPFLPLEFPGTWSRWLVSFVWIVAGVRVALKLIWVNRCTRLSVSLYLFLGWTILVATGSLFAAISPADIALLEIGGVLYSVGVLFHLWESVPPQQPICRDFVAAATVCHNTLVREVAVPAGPS